MRRTYDGECPYINDIHSIRIDYSYVPILGSPLSNYKKMQFECSLSEECPNPNNCPIYADAPKSITE